MFSGAIIPIISNIPVLSRMFGNTAIENIRVEMVILITGRIVTKESKLERMTRGYQQAINARKIVPNETIHTHAVELAYHRKEYKQTITFGNEAHQAYPKNKYFPFMIAQSHSKLHEAQEALEVMEKLGISGEHTLESNLLHLGLLMRMKKYDKALEKGEMILKARPRVPEYRAFLASFHYMQKNFQKSLTLFEQLSKVSRRDYLVEVGWLRFLLGKKQQAKHDLLLSTKMGSRENRALAYYRLGLIYSIDKKLQMEASQSYRAGYDLVPRLRKALEDHQLYLDVTDYKKDKIIQKNVRLFLK